MERLTTNKPASEMNMVELAYNCCYADKYMNARFRDFENDIDARELTRYLMHMHDEWDSNHEAMVSNEIFDICMHDNLSFEIDDIVGFIARFYQHLWAMADLHERLKHYEDHEEQLLKSAEIDLASMVGEFMHYYNLKKENRLLELPCKVGETVWCIEEDEDYEGYEDRFEIGGYVFMSMCGEYCFVSPHYLHLNDIEEQLEDMVEECENWGNVDMSIFHKSKVFLTKEEAEKALEEMEKNNG